jgi:hypothetical protein
MLAQHPAEQLRPDLFAALLRRHGAAEMPDFLAENARDDAHVIGAKRPNG